MFKVFYSWQSDLPNRTNRGLIQTALESACKGLKSADGVFAEAVVDRDTLGLAGAPSISEAILSKIRDSDAFVADVSLVNVAHQARRTYVEAVAAALRHFTGHVKSVRSRPTPNPNVLTELGYAMAQLGTEALVLVVNVNYGSLEELPFDLRQLRTLTYRAGPVDEVAGVRKELGSELAAAIKEIGGAVRGDPVDAFLNERTKTVAHQSRAIFFDLIRAAGVADPAASEADLNELFDTSTADMLATICEKADPNGAHNISGGTLLGSLQQWRLSSRAFIDEMMRFGPFLKREHVALLMRVETSSYFRQLDLVRARGVRNRDLSWLSSSMWEYMQLALKLQRYGERELARRAGSM